MGVPVIQNRDTSGRAALTAPDTETTRFCPECNAYLPKSEFYTDRRARGGLTRRCRTHHARKSYDSRRREYDTPAKRYAYARQEMLRKKYGMTVEVYLAMSEAQGHVCKICGNPETDKYGNLHVDHDHETNRVRGLLCGNCNTGLGKFRDDPNLLVAAIAYLAAARRTLAASEVST